jgi:hypothetical protein
MATVRAELPGTMSRKAVTDHPLISGLQALKAVWTGNGGGRGPKKPEVRKRTGNFRNRVRWANPLGRAAKSAAELGPWLTR